MNTLPEDQQNANHDHLPLPTNIGKMEVSDPAEYEYISQPWELMVTPLDRNPFRFHQTYLVTPSMILCKERFSSAIQHHGLTPDGMLGFTIPLKLGSKSLYWNAPMNQHALPASLPGALDCVIDAGQIHIIVLIELSLLVQMLTKEQVTALNKAATKRQLPIEKHALDSFTQWLLNLLSHAQLHVDIYQHMGCCL
jgi:AraC family ethanolamine operon transcriptional activator